MVNLTGIHVHWYAGPSKSALAASRGNPRLRQVAWSDIDGVPRQLVPDKLK